MSDTTTTDLSNYTDARQARGLDRLLDGMGHTVEHWTTPDPEPEPVEYERWSGMD